jgi:LPXTG-motif cell wall-anchored protein
VVSADGHPVSGSYSFSVVGAADSPPTPAAPAPTTSVPPPATATAPTGSDTTRSLLYAGIAGLAVGGVIAFWQSRKRRRDDRGKPDD